MKLPLIVAAAALLVVACGGAADVVVIGGEPDAGRLGALVPDASATVEADPPAPDASLPAAIDAGAVATDAGADPAPDAGSAPSDAGEDASDADTTCTVSEIPDGWAPSDPSVGCGAFPASEWGSKFQCPPCEPFVFDCTGAPRFPAELLDAGGTFRVGMVEAGAGATATCSSVPSCVRLGAAFDATWCDGGRGIDCSPGADGGFAVAPPAGCTKSGASTWGFCCPVADGG